MDFLEKLEYLLKEKGINKFQFSKESGIPYTTIVNFWAKGYENVKLSTLRRISNYFCVSLDYLVRDELTCVERIVHTKQHDEQKRRLTDNYDYLNQEGKKTLVTYSDDLTQIPKYTENAPDESKKQA